MSKKAHITLSLYCLFLTFAVIGLFLFCAVILARIDMYHPNTDDFGNSTQLSEQFTLYIGLNDDETNEQIMIEEDALKLVNQICLKNNCGYSSTVVNGGYFTTSGNVIQEKSLMYVIDFATEEQIVQIVNEVMQKLNNKPILVERKMAVSSFFYGNKNTDQTK